jgi:hypothetical protein
MEFERGEERKYTNTLVGCLIASHPLETSKQAKASTTRESDTLALS